MNKIIGAEGFKEIDEILEKIVIDMPGLNDDIKAAVMYKKIPINLKVYHLNTKTGEEKLFKEVENIEVPTLNLDQELLKVAKFYTIQSMYARGYKNFVFTKGQLTLEKEKNETTGTA